MDVLRYGAAACDAALSPLQLRSAIRCGLSSAVFRPCLDRVFVAAGLVAAIVVVSLLIVSGRAPALIDPLLSVLCGFLYASLFFLGHEAGHGSVVRSSAGRHLIMTAAFLIFGLSPTLWLTWHNQVHHCHTNSDWADPDNFGTPTSWSDRWYKRVILALTPGQGRWATALYLPVWFSVHVQSILWVKSYECPGFAAMNRRRVIAETLLIAAFWAIVCAVLPFRQTVLAVLVPMGIANAIIMSYIMTNHLLRPIGEIGDPLQTSMSVRTHPLLDLIHFNFSYHVEHHLFPAVSPKYAPAIREQLRRCAGDRYLAPPHAAAILLVFRTPRTHNEDGDLVDGSSGRCIRAEHMERMLRRLTGRADRRRAKGAPGRHGRGG